MRIGMDLRALQPGFKAHAGRGIGTMALELARRLPALAPELGITGLVEAGEPLVPEAAELAVERVPCPTLAAWPLARRQIRHQLLYPRALERVARELGLDALLFPSHLDAPASPPVPSVVCVQDLIPERWPELHPATWRQPKHALARRIEHRAVRAARAVVTTTDFVRRDVATRLGVPVDRIHVAKMGVDEAFRPRAMDDDARARLASFGVEPPYLLYVGGADPRKNVELLVDLAERILPDRPSLCLVLAGPIEEDPHGASLARRIRGGPLADRIVLPGSVPRETLPALYGGAELFLFPSLDEGFGLPPLEAMACGTPVLSSSGGALPEVLGDAALLLDPRDPAAWAAAASALLDGADRRTARAARGLEHARGFTWSRCAEAVARAVRDALAVPR